MRLLGFVAPWLALGCAQSEHAVLIEARSQGDLEALQVTVIDRSGARSPSRSSPRPIRRTRREINSGEPIRIAVPLPGPMDVLVHLDASGRDPDDRFVATRCYSVQGLVRDTVLLVGPIGAIDADGDGFPADPGGACRDPGAGDEASACDFGCARAEAGDCDDAEATIHPGAPELCRDAVDQDCDGEDSECEDRDRDGYNTCSAMDTPGTCDCDDALASVNPRAQEFCRDGVDQNCDGRDSLCDQDGDGFPADRDVGGVPDCDDTDPAIRPDAIEVCTSRTDPVAVPRDEDCNGFIDDAADCTGDDLDRDGSPACTDLATAPCPRTDCDCNDCDPAIRPGANDACGNGIDEDQRGGDEACPSLDADRDEYIPASAGGADCDDTMAAVFPGAPERCGDGIAQNCTEDVACTGDTDMDGYVGAADCAPEDAMRAPGMLELCNQVDDDCDGVTNEVLSSPDGRFSQGTSGCVLGDARLGAMCAGSGACVTDFTSSVFHCGGCRIACNVPGGDVSADVCADGVCDCSSEPGEAACPSGATCCSGAGCRDVDTDELHCGYCGFECGPETDTCMAGSCICDAVGRACDTTSAQSACCGAAGCVDLQNDNAHCGACGLACQANQHCAGGDCVCNPGFGNCDGNARNGCEVNLSSSLEHCNGCGNACTRVGASAVCVGGACMIGECNPLRADCDGVDGNGCEQSLEQITNCGGCRIPCSPANATETCAGGMCGVAFCDAGFDNCDGVAANGCERSLRTITDCGSCDQRCDLAQATESCASGICTVTGCNDGFDNCDMMDANGCEANLASAATCGRCGNDCGINATCAGGACACIGSFRDCDGMTTPGCETDISSTLSACGDCGMPCPATANRCMGGTCMCGSGPACDPMSANRCDSGSCMCGGAPACSGLSDTCRSLGGCGCGSGPPCSSTLADTCDGGRCLCGGVECDPDLADNCTSGACMCGDAPACTGARTCVGGTCRS